VADPTQDAEYMLCAECESIVAGPENYVSSVAVREDDSFPAADGLKPLPTPSGTHWQLGDASALDCASISHFAASVIWRASVSSLYKGHTLGDKYNKDFAAYLLGEKGFPRNAVLIVETIEPQDLPRVDRLVVPPEMTRIGSCHLHQFCTFGLWFRMMVGNVLPPEVASVSFVDKKLVLRSNGLAVLEAVAAQAKAAVPKGKLAKRK
jgi:hypothetical protein